MDRIIGGGGGIDRGTDHFKISEGICPLLCLTLSETKEYMFYCDMAQIIMVLKAIACYPRYRKMKRTMKLVIYL